MFFKYFTIAQNAKLGQEDRIVIETGVFCGKTAMLHVKCNPETLKHFDIIAE